MDEWARWHQNCTRQMGGLQLLTAQKKTSARAVQCSFTLGCCSRGPDSSLWSLGASAGSLIYPNIQRLPLECPVNNFISSVTQPNSQNTAHTSRKELFSTSAPSLLFHKAAPAQPPPSLVRVVGVNCCAQQLCCLSSLSLVCCADRGLQKFFARTTRPAAQGSGWLENLEMQVDQTFAFSLSYPAWKL